MTLFMNGPLVAQTSKSKFIQPHLEVLCAFDLSNLNMKINQRFGVVGRAKNEMEHNDIIEFQPGAQFKLIKLTMNSFNWLSLEDRERHLTIFCFSFRRLPACGGKISQCFEKASNK